VLEYLEQEDEEDPSFDEEWEPGVSAAEFLTVVNEIHDPVRAEQDNGPQDEQDKSTCL